jgi:hypothetical protein
MSKEIQIEIHDYDRVGRYLIMEDRKASLEEVEILKEKARKSVNLSSWDVLPEEARHIVYYAEMLDKDENVWLAAIYMRGEAYDDAEFDRIFTRPEIGYVGAYHKLGRGTYSTK